MNSLDLPQILYQPFAATGDKNTILDSPSTEDPQRANLQTGFPAVTQIPIDDGGIPPERLDFNGLGYLLSSFYFFTQCGGIYTFNQDVSNAIGGYPLGAVLYYTDSEGATYRVKSTKENNQDNFVTTPSYIGNSWVIVSDTPQASLQYIGDVKSSTRTANHGNWFLCNGQAISRTTYAELFSIIGTNFGAGDGSTTFNLPDYRGKFLRGLGGNSAADIYTTQAEGLPNITGTITSSTYLGIFGSQASGAFNPNQQYGWNNGNEGAGQSTNAASVSFNAASANSIYGASNHVTPINQAVNYFIKVI